MSGYSLLFLYIYCLVLRLTHSAITTESLCVRFMAILCPSTAIYHLLFSSLLLFFSCYVSGIPVYGAEEGKDGFHSTPVSSLLPKNKCSASARGEVPLTPKILWCRRGHSIGKSNWCIVYMCYVLQEDLKGFQ